MEEILIKEKFRNSEFSPNIDTVPSLMKSTNRKYSLKAIVDINAEEVAYYDKESTSDSLKRKRREISISVHNPKEPADTHLIPLNSIQIPLGHSTTFLISAKAREIDESGKQLTEFQRGCRLDEDTKDLDIFNVYTRVGCLFECKMKYSTKRCGCTPWNYPVDMDNEVRLQQMIFKYNTILI